MSDYHHDLTLAAASCELAQAMRRVYCAVHPELGDLNSVPGLTDRYVLRAVRLLTEDLPGLERSPLDFFGIACGLARTHAKVIGAITPAVPEGITK